MRRPMNVALAALTTFMLFSCDTLSGFPPLGNSGPAPRGEIPLYGNPVSGTGTLLMQLTDAPADYAKVLVTISEVAVHLAGDERMASASPAASAEPSAEPEASPSAEATPEASPSAEETLSTLKADKGQGNPTSAATADPVASLEEEKSWIKLAVTLPMPVDLLTLKDRLADLGLAELPAGKYTQIRLKVTSAQVVLQDGSTHGVKIPSGTLKLVHPFTIEAGSQTLMTLDFDAEKSVHKTGNGQYQMKPVIKVVATKLAAPSAEPTAAASPDPSTAPSAEPTAEPSADPSTEPTAEPTPAA